MLALRYLLMILGVGLFGSASALVVYDIFLSTQLRRLLRRSATDETGAEVAPLPTALSSKRGGGSLCN